MTLMMNLLAVARSGGAIASNFETATTARSRVMCGTWLAPHWYRWNRTVA